MANKNLAEDFEEELLADYQAWRSTLPRGDRNGTRYRGMITRFGAVVTMKKLLNSSANRRKPLQFGSERFVIQPKFQPLFMASEIQEAKDRLKQIA